jgi:dihydrofolate reductase
MAELIYSAIASLDGYVADRDGKFDWAAPNDDVHAFINDLLRPVTTHLYGRRMYEVLVAWETVDTGDATPPVLREFAEIWRAADKIVYSTSLAAPASARTRLERDFDADAVRHLKRAAAGDLSVGGPHLAARAMEVGLVDTIHLFLTPVVVGGGTPALPGAVRMELELMDERRFADGTMHLHYRTRP